MPGPFPLLLPDPLPQELLAPPKWRLAEVQRALEAVHRATALATNRAVEELHAPLETALRPVLEALATLGAPRQRDEAARRRFVLALHEAARRLDEAARRLARGAPLDAAWVAALERHLAQAGLLAPEGWVQRPSGLVVPQRGRPQGSGTFGSADELLAVLHHVVRELRKQGVRPTQAKVAAYLQTHGVPPRGPLLQGCADPQRQLRLWLRQFGLSWSAVVAE